MVFTVPRSKAEKQQKLVNIEEAYNLWDVLKCMYGAIERIQIWENFSHDSELNLIFKKFLNDFKKDVHALEKELKKYAINGPETNRSKINTSVNSEIILDEYLAQDFFLLLQEHIEMILRAFLTSTTNDAIRAFMFKLLTQVINRTDIIIKYLKIKGWLETPPLYPHIPDKVKERLDTGEAFHLWDHLAFRYDNINQTEIYTSFAYDQDFKIVLKMGLEEVLKKQVNILEKELEYFGIPLPKRGSNVINPPDNTEILKDEYMYRNVISGINGASIFHAQVMKQCTTNDRIRKIFKQLLLEEIKIIDKLIKFGNTKGWMHTVPQYRL